LGEAGQSVVLLLSNRPEVTSGRRSGQRARRRPAGSGRTQPGPPPVAAACGSPTYLLLARPRLEGTRVRLRSRGGAPHQHDAIARSCVPLREQLCSRTLRQLLQLSVREAVGVVAVAAVAAHPAVEHLKVVGSNRWTGDVECQLGREREGRGGFSADDCWVRGTTRLSWTGAGGGEGCARGREGRPPTPPGSARG